MKLVLEKAIFYKYLKSKRYNDSTQFYFHEIQIFKINYMQVTIPDLEDFNSIQQKTLSGCPLYPRDCVSRHKMMNNT